MHAPCHASELQLKTASKTGFLEVLILSVNKASTSIREGSRAEKHGINPYVNGKYYRWRRLDGVWHFQSSSTALARMSRPLEEPPELQEPLETTHSRLPLAILTTILQRGNSDPFDIAPIALVPKGHYTIEFSWNFQSLSHCLKETGHRDDVSLNHWWKSARHAINDEATALLLLAWDPYTTMAVHPSSSYTSAVPALQHKGARLRALQTKLRFLRSTQDNFMAFCILVALFGRLGTCRT